MAAGNQKGNRVENAFFVEPYDDPKRPNLKFKLTIRASFAGRRIRRFTTEKGVAYDLGAQLTEQIVERGLMSVTTQGFTIKKAVAWFLALPRLVKTSDRHQRNTRRVLDLLCGAVGGKALEFVTAEEVEKIVLLANAEATQANYFSALHSFFHACVRYRKLELNPMDALDKPEAKPRRDILTPAEMGAVLEKQEQMPEWLFAAIILGGFIGLRSVEILRMNWEDIDTRTQQVHIRHEVAKQTNSSEFDDRIIDFTPQLVRRKKALRGKGKLVPVNEDAFYDARGRLVKLLGWKKWPENCLRHSAATYVLAEKKSASYVANMLGHKSTIKLVTKTYAVPAKKADWKAWRAL